MIKDKHCVKNVCIRSFSGPYFPSFELNSGIQSECGKILTRKTPNTDTLYAVKRFNKIQLHSNWRTSNDSVLQIRLVIFPKFIHLKVHILSKNVTRCIQNPLKHLG